MTLKRTKEIVYKAVIKMLRIRWKAYSSLSEQSRMTNSTQLWVISVTVILWLLAIWKVENPNPQLQYLTIW